MTAAMLVVIGDSACALTVRDYVNQRDSADIERFKLTRIYISGLGAGYMWANNARVTENIAPLFCPPPNFKGAVDFAPLIDDEIGQSYVTRDDPIELLLMSSLARNFPCPVSQKSQ